VVEYTYDHLGRQVAVERTTSAGTEIRTWEFDIRGRLTRTSTPEGIVNYQYDVYGRKIRTFTGSSSFEPDSTEHRLIWVGSLHHHRAFRSVCLGKKESG